MRVSDFEELINKARLLVILRPCLSLSVNFQLNHEGFNKGNARRDGVV